MNACDSEIMPTLSVQDLETHFFTRDGIAKAVDKISFDVAEGEIMGLVGESGSGKSVTGFSILGLVDPPGEVVGGRVLFRGENLIGMADEKIQNLRGNRIAMIFQDPMMTLNPVLRVDTQMIETILAHDKTVTKALKDSPSNKGKSPGEIEQQKNRYMGSIRGVDGPVHKGYKPIKI